MGTDFGRAAVEISALNGIIDHDKLKNVKGNQKPVTIVVAASDSKDKAIADYICSATNDNVEIQAAIDALPTGQVAIDGGVVVLLEGAYSIGATITIPGEGVVIRGSGQSTYLQLAAGVNDDMFAADVATLQYGFTLEDIQMDGNKSNNTSGRGFYDNRGVNQIVDCHFKNVFIHNFEDGGIYIDNSWGLYISECIFEFMGNDAITITSGNGGYDITGCKIILNDIDDVLAGHGINVSASYGRISNNFIMGQNGKAGVYCTGNGTVIEGNTIYDTAIGGSTTTGIYISQDYNTISCNTIIAINGTMNVGIELAATAVGNNVTGNAISNIVDDAVLVAGDGNNISSNSIFGNTNTVDGIELSAGGDYNVVMSNVIYSCVTNGINDLGAGNIIVGRIDVAGTGDINLTGGDITLSSSNLITTGSISGDGATFTDDIILDGSTATGNFIKMNNGEGQVMLEVDAGWLRFYSTAGNVLSCSAAGGVSVGGIMIADTADSWDIGQSTKRFKNIYSNEINTSMGAVFNEDGGDNNFRVEGLTDANLLFGDAGEDRAAVGTNTPETKFHVSGGNITNHGEVKRYVHASNVIGTTALADLTTYRGTQLWRGYGTGIGSYFMPLPFLHEGDIITEIGIVGAGGTSNSDTESVATLVKSSTGQSTTVLGSVVSVDIASSTWTEYSKAITAETVSSQEGFGIELSVDPGTGIAGGAAVAKCFVTLSKKIY